MSTTSKNITMKEFADRLGEAYMNDSEAQLEEMIASLDESMIGHYLVKAFCLGSLPVVKMILDIHSPIALDFKMEGSVRKLNGMPLVIKNDEMDCSYGRGNDLNTLLEMAPEIGLGFLTGADGKHSEFLNADSLLNGVMPSGIKDDNPLPIPMFDGNTLLQPDLILALKERRDHSHYPKAYDQAMCFIKKDHLDQFPEAVVFKVEQRVVFRDIVSQEIFTLRPDAGADNKDASEKMEAALARAKMANAPSSYTHRMIADFSLTVSGKHVGEIDPVYFLAAHTFLTKRQKHGFDIPDGYALCLLNLDHLLTLQKGPLSLSNQERVKEFMSTYTPLGMIAYRYDMSDSMDHDMIDMRLGYNQTNAWIFNSYPPSCVLESLYAMGSKSLWKALISSSDLIRNENGFIHLHTDLGVDNDNMVLSLNSRNILNMSKKGVTLHPDTIMVDRGMYYQHREELKGKPVLIYSRDFTDMLDEGTFRVLYKMGMWPVYPTEEKPRQDGSNDQPVMLKLSKRPDSLAEALSMASRFKTMDYERRKASKTDLKISLRCFIYAAGAEAAAAVAKTDKQWQILHEIFRSEIAPFMAKAPASIKRKSLEGDLGL